MPEQRTPSTANPDTANPDTANLYTANLGWTPTSAEERAVLESLRTRQPIVRTLRPRKERPPSFGERMADRFARFGGSWTFILLFLMLLVLWTALNTLILRSKAFDPYPYIFLNLFLSMIAALQAPVIMMSQNRSSERDRLHAENDYAVNLKAEIEIRALHDKLDVLRERDWASLVALQQEQIAMLTRLVERGGTATS